MKSSGQLSNNWRVETHQSSTLASRERDPMAPAVNTRGEDDRRTQQAIDEGRRVYVGSLPYMANPGMLKNPSPSTATECK